MQKSKNKNKKSKKSKQKGEEKEEKEEKKETKLKTCSHVKARHILCEKMSKAQEAYNQLFEKYGNKPPASEFGKVAAEYSEDSTAKKGGDLGWFPRGKMAGPFQDVAFKTPEGQMSEIFKTQFGYHFLIVEGRKNS